MLRSHIPRQNQVTALFKDAFVTFPLPCSGTLAELAAQLAALGERHDGLPVYIDVKFGAAEPPLRN
jgi:hypothetical protein